MNHANVRSLVKQLTAALKDADIDDAEGALLRVLHRVTSQRQPCEQTGMTDEAISATALGAMTDILGETAIACLAVVLFKHGAVTVQSMNNPSEPKASEYMVQAVPHAVTEWLGRATGVRLKVMSMDEFVAAMAGPAPKGAN